MSDLEKLLSDCNNLKMLRNQVSMDGREIKRRNEIIDSWHIEKTWIKAYNEHKALEKQLSNSISKDEVRGLIEEYERGNFTAGCECGNIEACDILVDLSELLTNKEEG